MRQIMEGKNPRLNTKHEKMLKKMFFPKETPSSEAVFSPPKADSHAMAPHAYVCMLQPLIVLSVRSQQYLNNS